MTNGSSHIGKANTHPQTEQAVLFTHRHVHGRAIYVDHAGEISGIAVCERSCQGSLRQAQLARDSDRAQGQGMAGQGRAG